MRISGGCFFISIYKSSFSSIEIVIPPFPEQTKMVNLLSRLVHKIKLNQQNLKN
ncbi:MAG: restriction endonuclease subunit S [Oscillospiraceae bacterium]|nr:restriction endonuclease subunit S [Oscillospiraceae bacterium]